MHQQDGAPQGEDKIERIRDILFGAQAQDFQNRLNTLEETLFRTVESTRQQLTERIEHLERSLQDGLTALRHGLDEQRESHDKLSHDVKARAADDRREAERRIRETERKLEELSGRSETELRDAKNELSRRLDEALAGLRERVNQRLEGLESSKADRLRLAKLFADASEALVEPGPQSPDE